MFEKFESLWLLERYLYSRDGKRCTQRTRCVCKFFTSVVIFGIFTRFVKVFWPFFCNFCNFFQILHEFWHFLHIFWRGGGLTCCFNKGKFCIKYLWWQIEKSVEHLVNLQQLHPVCLPPTNCCSLARGLRGLWSEERQQATDGELHRKLGLPVVELCGVEGSKIY